MAARAELYGQYDAIRIGQFLADVAEVIVKEVLARACQQLSIRYPRITQIKSRFAIIAYGKLGAREMNYDSDLDLVFLHTAKPADENLVIRLTQKILHMLTTRSQTGILYSVDTRLRPSGSAGLLVSHLDAFIDYQRSHAWTWEHQSLLKARVLFANRRVKTAFIELKKNILLRQRNKKTLSDEIQLMRSKIDKHVEINSIKHGAGGLLDLEFLIQFLVLAHPATDFIPCTNTFMQLKLLQEKGIINQLQFTKLKEAYHHYHFALHQQLLQSSPIVCDAQQANVIALNKNFYL